MNYTAIDIETATPDRWSICQIGIVKVENFEIVEEKLINIKPPENKYFFHNTRIHGINSKNTEFEHCFDEHWIEIQPFIEGQLVVAHNVSFDINSIIQTLDYYRIPVPEINYFCTYQATGHRLIDICNSYNIQINHHNALSDAIACAKIYKMICLGEFDAEKVIRTNRKNIDFSDHKKIDSRFLKPDNSIKDSNSPFFKKKVVITGVYKNFSRDSVAEILVNLGADVNTTISNKTSFLISGENPGPSKIRKAIENNIPIISEEDFLKMIV